MPGMSARLHSALAHEIQHTQSDSKLNGHFLLMTVDHDAKEPDTLTLVRSLCPDNGSATEPVPVQIATMLSAWLECDPMAWEAMSRAMNAYVERNHPSHVPMLSLHQHQLS